MFSALFGTRCRGCGKRTRDPVPAPPEASFPRQAVVCKPCLLRLQAEAAARAEAEAKRRADDEARKGLAETLRQNRMRVNAAVAAAAKGRAEAEAKRRAEEAKAEAEATRRAKVTAEQKDEKTTFTFPATGQHPITVTIRTGAGADVNARNERGGTALILAATVGNIDNVQALIAAGADVDAKNIEGDTALISAAWNPVVGGDESGECVRALIAAGADVNARNSQGETALTRAARAGRVNSVEALIAAGSDVNAMTNKGNRPLTAAIFGRSVECVKILIAAGANVNSKDDDGFTPLMAASDEAIMEALIAVGADVNAETKKGETVLMKAKNNPILADILRAAGALDSAGSLAAISPPQGHAEKQREANAESMDELAYFPKGIPTRRELIAFGQSPREYHLLNDCAKGLPQLVLRDPPSPGIQYAAGGNIPDTEKYHYWHISKNLVAIHGPLVQVSYLSHFPKFEIDFEYADGFHLHSGERTGVYNIHFLSLGYVGEGPRYARVFLAAAGLDLTPEQIDSIRPGDIIKSSTNGPLIVRGIESARVEAERRQVEEQGKQREAAEAARIDAEPTTATGGSSRAIPGSRVDVRDEEGRTVLWRAAMAGNTEQVRALLAAGADVNLKYSDGITPLMLAAYLGNDGSVGALIAAGADVNAKASEGMTALTLAASSGRRNCVRQLLAVRADATAKDNGGNTALYFAVTAGDAEMVKLLVAAGADVNDQDKDGNTVLMSAAYRLHLNCVRALVEAGADVNSPGRFGESAASHPVISRILDEYNRKT
jgi:ankyrin repeat protein